VDGRLVRYRHGDCVHSAALAALVVEPLPAPVQTALDSPGGVDHARVMTSLAASELGGHPRRLAVLPSRLYQQLAGVLGASSGDPSLRPALVA